MTVFLTASLLAALNLMAIAGRIGSHTGPHFYQAPCLNDDGYGMSPFDTAGPGAMCSRTWQDTYDFEKSGESVIRLRFERG